MRLPNNRQVEVQKMIVIFVNRPMEGVLDRNHGRVDFALAQCSKDLFEPLARRDFHLVSQQLLHGNLAERALFSLEGHCFRRFRHF